MFERFSETARAAVVHARSCAAELGAGEIGAPHLLVGVSTDQSGVAARVLAGLGAQPAAIRAQVEHDAADLGRPDAEALRSLGIDLDEVRRRAEAAFGAGALERPRRQRRGLFGHRLDGTVGHLPLDGAAREALGQSLRAAVAAGSSSIAGEHLLLGLLAQQDNAAWAVLRRLGVTAGLTDVRTRVAQELSRAA